MTVDELKDEIVDSLTIELEDDPDFNEDILIEKVDNAVNEVMLMRRYARARYSESQIESDIVSFRSNIRDISLYDYNQSGNDFQSNHQENGINRSYMSRHRLFNGITPIAKVL